MKRKTVAEYMNEYFQRPLGARGCEMLCLDPSFTSTGWALFQGGRLVECGYLAPPGKIKTIGRKLAWFSGAFSAQAWRAELIVSEVPEVYAPNPRLPNKNPNKIVPAFMIPGAATAVVRPGNVEIYRPKEWKKNVDKVVMFHRVFERLDEEERAVYTAGTGADGPPKSEKARAGDTLDAIGLGLWKLRRL